MHPQDVVLGLGVVQAADVAAQQVQPLDKFACQSMPLWAIVDAGRSQAALTSRKGAAQSTPHQEKWSRGCRALKLQFWRFAWLPSWQLAPKRKSRFTWTTARLSPPNRPTPANTSNTIGRGVRAFRPTPALFLSATAPSADRHSGLATSFARQRGAEYQETPSHRHHWSLSCGRAPFSPCFFFPSLLPAPNPRRRPSLLLRSRPSQPTPANTNNTQWQARSGGPATTQPLLPGRQARRRLSQSGDLPVEGGLQTRMRGQPC